MRALGRGRTWGTAAGSSIPRPASCTSCGASTGSGPCMGPPTNARPRSLAAENHLVGAACRPDICDFLLHRRGLAHRRRGGGGQAQPLADLRLDLVGQVGVVAQEPLGVVASLAEAQVAVGVPGAALD